MNQAIYHLANSADAARLAESGHYHTASLTTEGFIHCCTAEQMAGVIQRYYAEAQELVVLEINDQELNAELVFENTVGGEELFPHVYGEINQSAVRGTEVMARERIVSIATSGTFLGLE